MSNTEENQRKVFNKELAKQFEGGHAFEIIDGDIDKVESASL